MPPHEASYISRDSYMNNYMKKKKKKRKPY